MAPAQLEKRITMISTGGLPSSKLLELGASRPFVHQAWTITPVDVVFPFDRELEAAFSKLETDYCTSRAPLAEVYEALRAYSQQPGLAREGSIILSAGKETFEALGLPGAKFSSYMSGAPEQYLINVSLNTPSANVRSHDFILSSFTRWDRSREESGEGQWDFAFHVSTPDQGTGPLSPSHAQRHEVKPVVRKLQNVHIPTSTLPPHPHPTSTGRSGLRKSAGVTSETDADDDDALQDWNEKAGVFIIVEMIVRIEVFQIASNDRVDPYVAVYSAPAPSTIGDMLHTKWNGLLTPEFVQRIVDTAIHVGTSSGVSLIGLTIHGSTEVPVLTPHRVPRSEGEDTVSVILTPGGVGDAMINASASGENSLVGE
ncbi:ribonuclease P 40kDa subunit-domain-containing protein [Lactifluus subvellereus]|nr:ribonuclease P 40kDa subunit-domain-containing protein [Lactifluus subvellereus]